MAMLLQRARRIAWNMHANSKSDTASVDSGYAESYSGHRSQPTRCIQRLSRSAGFDKFTEALKQDGCVVVKDFTDMASLDMANDELMPYLEKELENDARFDGWRGRTRTITQLMRRSPTMRETFFTDNLYQSLCELFISTESVTWNGTSMAISTSHPVLSSAITFDMPLGASAQGFHRDDQYYHARHCEARKYDMGRDMLLGLFIAGSDADEDSAAKVVLGSHLWGDDKPPLGSGSTTQVTDVPLQKGEALIMLGSVYYGGGCVNSQPWTELSSGQLVHAIFSCSGVYRQEENPFLTYTNDEVSTYSDLVQERLGWKQREPSLGWVDLKSPEFLLQT